MNLSPVARLKKTWSKVKTAKFDVLEVGTPSLILHWPEEEGGPPIMLSPLTQDLSLTVQSGVGQPSGGR